MEKLIFQKISLPKESIEGNHVVFESEVSLQELASYFIADSAYDAGSCNGYCCFGGSRVFASTASGHILCGYIRKDQVFSVEAILLPNKRSLIKKFWGHNYHPEFKSLLKSLGFDEEISVAE